MLDLRDYKLLDEEAADIVEALKEMVDWVTLSPMKPNTFTWVLRYADIQPNAEPLDPLLRCAKFAKLLPFEVNYETNNVIVIYSDIVKQMRFNELIWGLQGSVSVMPRKGVAVEYRLLVNKRLVLVEYFYEYIDGEKIECLTISIRDPEEN